MRQLFPGSLVGSVVRVVHGLICVVGRLGQFRSVGRRFGDSRADQGMSTAEYAVGTIAAVAFAALLYKVVNSPTVMQALTTLVGRALRAPF